MACVLNDTTFDPCNVKPGGVQALVQWYKYNEWLDMKAAGNVVYVDGVITSITNPVGIKAYRIDTPDESVLSPTSPPRKVTGGINGFDHGLNFAAVGTEKEQKDLLNYTNNKRIVAIILKKNGKGEIYGDEQGIEQQANTFAPGDPNLGGTTPGQLNTSPDSPAESSMPADIYDTDDATTKALIEGLNIIGT